MHTVHPSTKVVPPNARSKDLISVQEMSPEKIDPIDASISTHDQMDTENTENTEQTGDSNSEEVFHAETHTFIKLLTSEIHKKYPDVIELVTLSPEKILEKYPTEADIHTLKERVLQYEAEYLEDIRYAVKTLIWTGQVEDMVDIFSQIQKTLASRHPVPAVLVT